MHKNQGAESNNNNNRKHRDINNNKISKPTIQQETELQRNTSPSANENNEVLTNLLNKLRPFQREAYEFATQGKSYQRQYSAASDSSRHDNKHRQHHQQPPSPDIDPSLLGKGRILLADEMGLGKTVTSLAIMAHYYPHEWPLLILCPASLRHTWPGEIEKFLPSLPPSSIYVVQGFDDADFFENTYKRQKIKIVVASFSLLQTRSAAARCLQQFQFQCVIVDESHNLKQRNSQRTQLALPLLQNATRLVLLSGTPALARPVELWTQISTLAPTLFADNYTQFTKRYCNAHRGRFGWDVSGLSNPDELHLKLKQIMVRRLKSQVLHELPAKQRSIVPIQIPKGKARTECQTIMKDLQETRQSIHELLSEEAAQGAHFEARTLLMQAYQASGVAKAAGVCEYLLEWLRGSGNHKKVLVFAHHKGVLDALEVAVAKEFKGRGHIRIDGQVPSQERALRVKKFQTSSQIRVGLLSMTAAGVGLTLTAATTVMFAELHWTPGVLAQAEDRCHRIGQRNAVHVQYLVCHNSDLSVDMQLWAMLGRKIGTLGRVVDGEKNAHLNADVKDDTDRVGGQSVQDELQDFFAETSPQQDLKTSPKVPVKGTIMSFFQKQQQQPPKSAKVSPSQQSASTGTTTRPQNQDPVDLTSTRASSFGKQPTSPFFAATTCKPQQPKTVEWACKVCTYLNTIVVKVSSKRLACEMCQQAYSGDEPDQQQQQHTSPTVTPPSARKKGQTTDDGVVLVDLDPTPETTSQQAQSHCSSSSSPDTIAVQEHVPSKRKRAHSSPENPIVLMDNHNQNAASPSSPSNPAPVFNSTPDDPIVIDECDPTQTLPFTTTPNTNKRKKDTSKTTQPTNALLFSVSRNSGRITIHYAATGKSSQTNFELDQILSPACSDSLMRAQITRKSASKTVGIPLEFNQDALDRVLEALDHGELRQRPVDPTMLKREIQEFVKNYLGLREVEKKALKESEQPFASAELKRAVLRLMTSTTVGNCTERYAGGARERARERMSKDMADETDMAILEGRLCAWCGGKLPTVFNTRGVDGTYCKRECAERGRLNTSTGIREQLFALEGGVCRGCGIDAHALFTRISALQPAERLNALCNAKWKLPRTAKALDRLLQDPKEGDFWEADHIKAVAEGGGGCGLENIRTLCVPCHQEETSKLRARLKLSGGSASAVGASDSGKKRQKDIRAMFQPVASSRSTKRFRRNESDL